MFCANVMVWRGADWHWCLVELHPSCLCILDPRATPKEVGHTLLT